MDLERQSVEGNLVVVNAAISGCEKAGKWQFSVQLGHKNGGCSLDVRSCGALISACEKGQRWERALLLLELGKSHNSLVGYNAAISACGNKRRWPHAQQLFTALRKRRLQPTDVTVSATVVAFDSPTAHRWSLCLCLVDANAALGAKLVTGNALLQLLSSAAGSWKEVIQLFCGMRSAEQADEVTFASALVGCILGNQVAVARDILQTLRTVTFAKLVPP